MSDAQPHSDAVLGTVKLDGRSYEARARVAWDGVEFIARIFFHRLDGGGEPIPDRGAYPGRDRDEALQLTTRLTSDELAQRLHRALIEKRECLGLRAGAEIDLTERQIHALVSQLREHAGVVS